MNAVTKAARKEIAAALDRADRAAQLGAVSDHELLELLRGSALPEKLHAEQLLARRRRRAELVAAKERELAALEREMPALAKKRDDARAAFATKERELEAARATAAQAQADVTARDIRCRYAVTAIDAELAALAPAAIDVFVERKSREVDELRSGGFLLAAINIPGAEGAARQNAERGLLIEGKLAAIRKAEELKLLADDDAIVAALDALEASELELGRAARAERGQPA